MDLARGVRAAIARQSQSGAYLGTVTEIDATNLALAVDIGTGTPLTGVRWVSPYAPTVGDFVTVLRAGTAWIVLGRLSKDLTGPGFVEVSDSIRPTVMYAGQLDELDPFADWMWFSHEVDAYWDVSQGHDIFYGNTGVVRDGLSFAGVVRYPMLAARIPPGATITSAKITMERRSGGSPGPVSPVLYGHAYTAIPAGEPAFVSGYGPWQPGGLLVDEVGRWDMPSTWLSALVAGTLTGFAVYSTAVPDYSVWVQPSSFELSFTYRMPA